MFLEKIHCFTTPVAKNSLEKSRVKSSVTSLKNAAGSGSVSKNLDREGKHTTIVTIYLPSMCSCHPLIIFSSTRAQPWKRWSYSERFALRSELYDDSVLWLEESRQDKNVIEAYTKLNSSFNLLTSSIITAQTRPSDRCLWCPTVRVNGTTTIKVPTSLRSRRPGPCRKDKGGRRRGVLLLLLVVYPAISAISASRQAKRESESGQYPILDKISWPEKKFLYNFHDPFPPKMII